MTINWKKVWLIILIVILSFAALILLFFQTFGFYRVSGTSMEPSLKNGGTVTLLKWDHSPKPGEIIVFSHGSYHFIKRVVAIEGDTVEGKNNTVYVNKKPLKEEYLKTKPSFQDFGPVKVPENAVFVLSDNRTNSLDSRDMGPIVKDKIRGVLIAY
ncbi:signal peptidase I [Marinithermofilum abyssi]|uniref:Signal peptidase I n=1 Tax=Marinithermofilum abyssi TaxID=1571185 RepID=A0A8J2VD34_9BACL|nr:signal peptidase I [Marinithermofilum abyssi]GGE21449.1 signal peptidase I [Marinithermofilum abyssi]